jgi:hypothetical protein
MNYHVCHDSNWACRCGIVTRDEMLAEIWNTPFTDSNKVEPVVRSLRTKLGPYASSVETVTGHGYRFRGWKRNAIDGVVGHCLDRLMPTRRTSE